MKPLIAPSLLAADFANLRQDIEMVNNSEADCFHLDIMDGVFVPNISFGLPIVKAVKNYAKKPLDVHLMIVKPEKHLASFHDAGADTLTVHIETCKNLHQTLQDIRELGMKAGISLNPHTPVELLKEFLPFTDRVLIMSVNPGYGGQQFIETSYEKIRKLKKMIFDRQLDVKIAVDGGVDVDNAARLVDSGVDILVAGTAIFGSDDPAGTIRAMKNAVTIR
jgi:ribulose-phosphate 3-epimerase